MTLLHLFDGTRRRLSVECQDDEACLWIRDGQQVVSIQLNPRVLLQLEAAMTEARKFFPMETEHEHA
jgi:hypothetical protein